MTPSLAGTVPRELLVEAGFDNVRTDRNVGSPPGPQTVAPELYRDWLSKIRSKSGLRRVVSIAVRITPPHVITGFPVTIWTGCRVSYLPNHDETCRIVAVRGTSAFVCECWGLESGNGVEKHRSATIATGNCQCQVHDQNRFPV